VTPDDLVDTLTEAVRLTVGSYPLNSLEEPDAWDDLTCRLILEFARRKIVIVPKADYDSLVIRVRNGSH